MLIRADEPGNNKRPEAGDRLVRRPWAASWLSSSRAFCARRPALVGSALLQNDDIKSNERLVVRMERSGAAKGRLVDEDGQPLSGAKLKASISWPDGIPRLLIGPDRVWPDQEVFTADAAGRFQIDGLRKEIKTDFNVSSTAQRRVRLSAGEALKGLTAEPGEVRDLGDVVVTPEAPQ